MSTISIVDLEVHYRVGVPDEERAKPQRLLISVKMDFDFTNAAKSDAVEDTINYYTVSQELLKFGEGRSWKLLERLVSEIADRILFQFRPLAVSVEVKKFIIPQARYVSVSLTRQQN
jgi:FolB domain-containing protein